MKSQLVTAAVFLAATTTASAAALRSYHIGNSLTNMPVRGMVPEYSLPALAATAGDESDIGYQIKCGDSLEAIWQLPTTTCVPPNSYGYFKQALPFYPWDAVTFEPYYDPQAEARTTIGKMVNLLRPFTRTDGKRTQLYVYQAWPQYLGNKDYSQTWTSPYVQGDPDNFHRDYFQNLTQQLRDDLGPDVHLIPAGEALYRIDQLAKAGKVPGITNVKEWYIDPAHLNGYGNFLATEMIYATMYGKNPSAIAVPYGIPPELKAVIDTTVWDVINNEPLTFAVTAPVPEPSATLAVFCFGLASIRRGRSRRS